MTKIAIIGGSGLEDPAILKDPEDIYIETPYGEPTSGFKCGKIGGVDVAILSRHGRDHSITPSQVNNPVQRCAGGDAVVEVGGKVGILDHPFEIP